jgi:hypothetical protein
MPDALLRQSSLPLIAPRIARAHAAEQARRMDGVSRCYHGGWHANGAGPCCSSIAAAIAQRDREDREALTRGDHNGPYLRDGALRRRIEWRLGLSDREAA